MFIISYGTLVMKGNSFFHSYLKVVLVEAALVSFECFTFFLLGLGNFDDSAILKFYFEYFPKDLNMSKQYN